VRASLRALVMSTYKFYIFRHMLINKLSICYFFTKLLRSLFWFFVLNIFNLTLLIHFWCIQLKNCIDIAHYFLIRLTYFSFYLFQLILGKILLSLPTFLNRQFTAPSWRSYRICHVTFRQNNFQQISAHRIEVFSEPFCPFLTCWTHIHLQKPRLTPIIKQNIISE